jgi:ribonuclease BN (tRNA processing enzyme)
LGARLSRYLSPPLFPVRLSELPCRLALHNVPLGRFEIGGVRIDAALITHPGPTVGYRIDDGETCLAYLPDHEPALGASKFPLAAAWTSGFDLAEGADLLIHDTQYSAMEYSERVGWGHSTVAHALEFARLAGVKRFLAFHHDPGHDDVMLDRMLAEARTGATYPFEIIPGIEGTQLKV